MSIHCRKQKCIFYEGMIILKTMFEAEISLEKGIKRNIS
jgi:hypothetical protein